jgi:hypothetical protein
MGTLSNFILVILDIVCLMFTMKRSTDVFELQRVWHSYMFISVDLVALQHWSYVQDGLMQLGVF